MTPMADSRDRQLERFVRGDLSPAETRELAHAALQDPELFDALAAHGLVEDVLQSPEAHAALESESEPGMRRFPNRTRMIAVGALAAGIALVAIYLWRPSSGPVPRETAALKPSLDLSATGPILIAENLKPNASTTAPAFRSVATESRLPRNQGTVLTVEGQEATVNLGSLDGISKASEMDVFRGASDQPVGRLTATAVFLDRSRARVTSGTSLKQGDRIRVDDAVYLRAVLDEMNALEAGGNSDKARSFARDALASVPAAPAGRAVWEGLAALDYRAGDTTRAVSDYQSAIALFAVAPAASNDEQAATLNSLAAIYLLQGDTAQAELRLNQARAQGVGSSATLNNLGVLAELRGDKSKAGALYQEARRDADPGTRAAVERNLSRIQK